MPENPHLDLRPVRFPTDRITIAQLRREQPELFTDAAVLRDSCVRELNISATIVTEMAVVQYAFAKALRLPNPFPTESQRERINWLNQDYRRYGISTGINQTRLLVRDLEHSAEEQAKRYRVR